MLNVFFSDAMKPMARLHPELLAQKIQNCKTNFRNQEGLELLLKHAHDILSKKS